MIYVVAHRSPTWRYWRFWNGQNRAVDGFPFEPEGVPVYTTKASALAAWRAANGRVITSQTRAVPIGAARLLAADQQIDRAARREKVPG